MKIHQTHTIPAKASALYQKPYYNSFWDLLMSSSPWITFGQGPKCKVDSWILALGPKTSSECWGIKKCYCVTVKWSKDFVQVLTESFSFFSLQIFFQWWISNSRLHALSNILGRPQYVILKECFLGNQETGHSFQFYYYGMFLYIWFYMFCSSVLCFCYFLVCPVSYRKVCYTEQQQI